MNKDLFAAAVEYSKWYVERFKATQPDWYVFPAGGPRPNDPTRPQTTLKTAWRNARKNASVEGRFHDNRHTFVTDLAESGAGDEVIRDMAGHVSKDMLKHYSHIRMQAKRQAVENLTGKPKLQESQSKREPAQAAQNSDGMVQDPVQVNLVS
jgi:integrase